MSLTPHDIAKMLDHSTLQPFLTEEDIRRGCEVALKYDTASVCARPGDMKIVAEMLKGIPLKASMVYHTQGKYGIPYSRQVWYALECETFPDASTQ